MTLDDDSPSESKAYQQALKILAGRDHACAELELKLCNKGHEPQSAKAAVELLVQQGWVNDQRFGEQFVRSKFEQGYGPLRIAYELEQKGVDRPLINAMMKPYEHHWLEAGQLAYKKRFGEFVPEDVKQHARNRRYLYQRGFNAEQIRLILQHLQGCDD
jgi:regulatory protein